MSLSFLDNTEVISLFHLLVSVCLSLSFPSCTSIPCFIALCFIVHHAVFLQTEDKTQQDYHSLVGDTRSVAVVWNEPTGSMQHA